MARSRNIKPSFFMNERLADCPPLARILFAGLWTIADRKGRLEDRPKKIKAEVLPYDECDIENLLNYLSKNKFITRYEVKDENFIEIINFSKHQNPHNNEVDSVIPSYTLATKVRSTTEVLGKYSGLNPYPLTLNPHTDSPIPQTNADGDFFVPQKNINFDKEFGECWKIFPNTSPKGSKVAAKEKFIKLRKKGESYETIYSGIERYAKYCSTGTYNQHFTTWINQGGWKDEWESNYESPRNPRQNQKPSQFDTTKAAFELVKQAYDREDGMDAGGQGEGSGWEGNDFGREFSGEPQKPTRALEDISKHSRSNFDEEGN